MATSPTPGNGAAPGISLRRVIACSGDRTLSSLPERDGRRRLMKVFDSGSLADAEREFTALRAAAGPGVAPIEELLRDPATGKPALTMEHLDGIDLEELVAKSGPLPSPHARILATAIARVLERLAALRHPDAPSGLVHGDVKPANILVAGGFDAQGPIVHLLDFEHAATPAAGEQATTSTEFRGGTHGYAPPEAYGFASPTAAFDVFGLGRTLRRALTGQHPPLGAAPWPPDLVWRCVPAPLRQLVDTCQAVEPTERPNFTQILARLAQLPPSDDAVERTRAAILAANFADARAEFERVPHDAAPRADLQRLLSRRERLAARAAPPHGSTEAVTIDQTTARNARRILAWLRRFPGDRTVIAARESLLARFVENCTHLPIELRALEREGSFGLALQRVDAAREATLAIVALGRLPLRGLDSESVAPIHRAPLRVLELAARSIHEASARFERRLESLQRAEAALDFAAARSVLDDVTASYGGASELTAMLKRRCLEFGYALGRIAGAADLVAELRDSADTLAIDLDPLAELVASCASSELEPRSTPHGRGLLRCLTELTSEYPHVANAVDPAIEALRATLTGLTRDAWQTLARVDVALTAQPIPIRPLQADLHRLERLDFAGLLVDLPARSRAELLDAIESARVRIDRARATRDRLARGAVEALDQGRLTTALFEMERVANEFDDETSRNAQARQPSREHAESGTDVTMHDRLAQAKQLKLEVEQTMRRNHELAAHVAELQRALAARAEAPRTDASRADDVASDDPHGRLDAALAEREAALAFLAQNVAVQRRETYAADLAQLRAQRFDRARSLGEARYAASPTPRETAFEVARDLALRVPKDGWDQAQLAAARASIRDFHARAEAQPVRARPRRRRLAGIATAGALAVVALGWGLARGAHSARRDANTVPSPAATDSIDARRARLQARASQLHADVDAAEPVELLALRARLRTLCDEVAELTDPVSGQTIERLFAALATTPPTAGHSEALAAAHAELLAIAPDGSLERELARVVLAYAQLAGFAIDPQVRGR